MLIKQNKCKEKKTWVDELLKNRKNFQIWMTISFVMSVCTLYVSLFISLLYFSAIFHHVDSARGLINGKLDMVKPIYVWLISKLHITVIPKDYWDKKKFQDMGPLSVNAIDISVLLFEKKTKFFNLGFFFYRPISSFTL